MSLRKTTELIEQGEAAGLHIGAQLSVSRAGETVFEGAWGVARPGVSMTTDTLMPWLSATKIITAIAVAREWERGEFDLDERVSDHIPAFAVGGKEAITIRHLLTHTGGFRSADRTVDAMGDAE